MSTRAETVRPGTVLQGRYRIQSQLGAGGMSTVYRARDLRFAGVDRPCAIKEMYNLGGDTRTREFRLTTFQREAALLATLSHPAIPRIYDFFEHQGSIFLVLELIQGQDLETLLAERGGPFLESDIITWSLELCDVLAFLHGHQPEPIIFRDLKPSNVMIRSDGHVVLIDFGIARSFVPDQKGTMIGTEGYSPPEQYRGVADVSGEIYAFGATLHHLATNSDPRNETPFTFAQRPPKNINPAISDRLQDLILTCVNYAPSDRFGSIDEVRQALLQLRLDADIASTSTPMVESNRRNPNDNNTPPQFSTASARNAAPNRVAWVVATSDEVRGSAEAGGEMVYVGSYDGHLYAIHEPTGSVRWKCATRRGVVSRPIARDDAIVFGSEDHNVYAVSRSHGRVNWSFRTSMPVRSSPAADDTTCFVGSDDGFVYRLDRKSGVLKWRYRTWGPVRSSPIVTNGRLILGSDDGYLYALDPETGRLLWRQQFHAAIVASAAPIEKLVVIAAMDGVVRGVSVDNGRVVWAFKTGRPVLATAAIEDRTAYVASSNGIMYSLNSLTGSVLWQRQVCKQITSSASVSDTDLFVGGADGVLRCLDRSTGDERWHITTNGPIVARPLVTPTLVIAGSLDGRVYAVHRDEP
ncbi:MAG: PQQ-binding-like beta-propeller repeat protein [Thermomicrobiales bacterium]